MKVAVFPGSFDPITKGHQDIVKRALPLFDKIIIAVGTNSQKSGLFPVEQRMKWIRKVFKGNKKIQVETFQGLTVHYCKKVKARYLVRGLRQSSDFDYEKTISQLNNAMSDKVETVFLISRPEYSHISSTIVREIIKGGGKIVDFVPKTILPIKYKN